MSHPHACGLGPPTGTDAGKWLWEFEGELGVRLAGAQEEGYDSEVSYEAPLVGQLVFGDLEFGKANEAGVGRRSFVTKILTQQVCAHFGDSSIDQSLSRGVHGNLVGLSRGAFDNFLRFEVDQIASIKLWWRPSHCQRFLTSLPFPFRMP